MSTTYPSDSFVENINYIANLDKRLGTGLHLSKSNIIFNGGTQYSAIATLKVYNMSTFKTEVTTTTLMDINISTIDAFLANVKSELEAVYPITITSSSSYSIGYAAINVDTAVNDDTYYLRDLVIDIKVGIDTKYSIGSDAVGSLELIPALATITDEEMADMRAVVELVPHLPELLLVDDKAAEVAANLLLTNKDVVLANASAEAASLSAMAAKESAQKILDLTVSAEELPVGDTLSVTYDPNVGDMHFGFPKQSAEVLWGSEDW